MPPSPADAARVADLVARPALQRALAWVEAAGEAIGAETSRITEIPAPTFQERARAAYVAERFAGVGLVGVEVAADGNVYGLLPGEAEAAPVLALFAHLDTVFAADVPVAVSRRNGRLYAPGIGDNSAGVAGLLIALEAMQEARLRPVRPVWIVATVGEEGLGNLAGAQAATRRLGRGLAAVLAVEGSFFGRVSHTAVGSRRFRVRMQAEGGHSWHDFGRPSALHALIRAAAQIAALEVSAEPRTTYNIGELRGGTGVNVIAECAEMLVDMRSVDARALDRIARRVRAIVEGERAAGVAVEVEVVGDRPAGSIPPSHPLVRTCSAVLQHLGVRPQFAAASTDANAPLGRGIPAVTLGVTRGGGAHTLGEWIDLAPMVPGVQQLVLAICALAEPTDARLSRPRP
jgi:acetylornithine deacetylase/succinyl-diaminopimelate desuccinylase-like protein